MRHWRFVKLFPNGEVPSDEVLSAYRRAMEPNRDKSNVMPAGLTYFGQFVAHDLTELRSSERKPGNEPLPPNELTQLRRPGLELDSLYGGGLDDCVVPYDRSSGKFVLGKTADDSDMDLPREADGKPRIADQRNDENLLVAQMHLLWMRYHNALVDWYRRQPGGWQLSADQLFADARRELAVSYRWVTLHHFARRLLPPKVYRAVIQQRRGMLTPRRHDDPVIAVEFAGAALRFGHSMIRNSYQLQDNQKATELEEIFRLTGARMLNAANRLPGESVVDWTQFFTLEAYGESATGRASNEAFQIDTSIDANMQALMREHGRVNIIQRNLRRGRELGIVTGQDVAAALEQTHPDMTASLGLGPIDVGRALPTLDAKFADTTPLWVYVLAEAQIYSDGTSATLGPLGGWLVADGLLAAADVAATSSDEDWQPETSAVIAAVGRKKNPQSRRRELTLDDIVVFTDLVPDQ